MHASHSADSRTAAESTVAHGLVVWGPLLLLWVLWGSTYLGIAIVVDVLPPLIATGMRLVGGGLILATGLIIAKGPGVLRIDRSQFSSIALLGLGMPALGLGTLALAERYVPTGVAALVIAANPLWIVLLRNWSGDRPARATLIGVAVGLLGLGYLLLPGGTVPRAGTESDVALWSIVLLLGSLSWAFSSWRSTSMNLPRDSLVAAAYELAFGGLLLILAGAIAGERLDMSAMQPSTWIAWVGLAVASAIGYAAFTWLIARAPLSLVSTYAYVNPLVAVILGAVVLGEVISRDVVWGLIVVLGGVVLVVSGERARS